MDLLLLHPPAVKAAEPPLGLAVLQRALREKGIEVGVIDANLEALRFHLQPGRLAAAAGDRPATALHRAVRHAPAALELLRSPRAAASFARYAAAVSHLETALGACGGDGEHWGLGDYRHGGLSPFAPADLERLARGEAATLFRGYFRDVLLPRVAACRPRLIGLSMNYLHQVLPAFELAGLLARALPGVPVVGGGGVFSSWAGTLRRQGLRFSPFTRLVLGPGEAPLAALVRGETDDRYLQEGASCGFTPDFSGLPPAAYLSPHPVLPVGTSRGCYWRRCLFCPEATAPTHPYAELPPPAVPDLLLDLAGRYGVRHFHLTDNAVPPPTLRALAARGEELGRLAWHGFVRFEPELAAEEFADALARSGCRLLQLGLESGSQRVLDRLGKGTRLATAGRILANLKRAGIGTYVYVMLGTPGESEEDARATLDFLEAHAPAISFLNLAIMNLPRDSALLADPDSFGIAGLAPLDEAEPLGLYRTFTPAGGWGRGEARRFLSRRLQGSPAIRAILNRTPPVFTSHHAFFFPVDPPP